MKVSQQPIFSGVIAVLISWGGYFTLLWPRLWYWSEDGLVAGWLGVWADWAVHATYASVFAWRPVNEWFLNHPLYLDRKFTYPFLADALSGWLLRIGFDWVNAFLIPSILMTLLLLVLMYIFFWNTFAQEKISTSLSKAYLAVTLFLTSGGLGFWWFFQDWRQDFTWKTLLFPPKEYTHIGEFKIEWINVVSGQLVPQRALLLGMIIALGIIVTLQHLEKRHFSAVKWWQIFLLSVSTALLIVTHMHTFIVLVFLCAVWFGLHWRSWKFWVQYAIVAGLMSIPLFWSLYGGEIDGGFFRFLPGWLANPRSKDVNWFWFWWLNWGMFLPLALWGTLAKYWKNPVVLTGWIVWILSNLFLFQPYDWDNSKLLTWSYLFFALPVTDRLFWLWNRRWFTLQYGVTMLLFLILTLSGWLDLWRLTRTDKLSHLLWSHEEMYLAEQFRLLSDTNAIVLTSDQHRHWVPALTGRQILLGYKGWMWTYGIRYTQREQDVLTMFAGGVEAERLFDQYQVDYVVIDQVAKYDLRANESWYQANTELVLSTLEHQVFKVNKGNE